jgi:DNA-binding XRE family transcriptional regulator
MKNFVQETRLSLNISQTQFAFQVGVSRQTIHAVETGKYVPSVELALRIADELGKRVEDLFKLAPPRRKANKDNL